jgi:hypothetical protein
MNDFERKALARLYENFQGRQEDDDLDETQEFNVDELNRRERENV